MSSPVFQIPTEKNILKHLSLEVYTECNKRDIDIDLKFVEFLVDLLLLNPKFSKLVTKPLTRISLSYFEAKCMDFILRSENQLKTLKLQYIFNTFYTNPKEILAENQKAIVKCTQPLLAEIVKVKKTNSTGEVNTLFRKISVYIILSTGLGNPSEIMTLKENTAALESVYPKGEIKNFIVMSDEAKTNQIDELVSIVAGIRLFNKSCKKGGDTIPEVPKHLTESFQSIQNALMKLLEKTVKIVAKFTTAIENLTALPEDLSHSVILELPTESMDPNDIRVIREALNFYRQLEAYIRMLLKDVEKCMIHSNLSIQTVGLICKELNRIVRFKEMVPLISVFPYFNRLWQQWSTLQNQLCVMSNTISILTTMESLEETMTFPEDAVDQLLVGKEIVTDQQRLMIEKECDDCLCKDFGFLSAVGSKVALERDLQYLGFCPMSLLAGLLVPGNPKLRATINHKEYAFCKKEFKDTFCLYSGRYIDEILEFARNNPCLIHLLNIYAEVDSVKFVYTLHKISEQKHKTASQEIQTDIHPIKQNIVHNYQWNLWRHKETAVQWTNLVNCSTHSTQTLMSHCRGDIQCQTVDPHDKVLQTRHTTAAGVPHPIRHIWKVRCEGDQVCDLDLTRPIDE